jgi:hypothetical protein
MLSFTTIRVHMRDRADAEMLAEFKVRPTRADSTPFGPRHRESFWRPGNVGAIPSNLLQFPNTDSNSHCLRPNNRQHARP